MRSSRWLLATGLVLSGFFVCLGLDALIFRFGPYPKILEPDSSGGLFELILREEKKAQQTHGDNLVATLGDSRLGYYPRVSAEVSGRTGILLRSAGIAGSTPRIWYYMLRDLDPTARRYRAIVLAVNDYEDIDEYFNPAEDLRSLHYTAARLRFTDIPEFTLSFDSTAARWQAFRGSLFKGLAFQQDVLAFLKAPAKRLAEVKLNNEGYLDWTWNFVATNRNMVGLKIDWATRKAVLPPDANQAQRDTVNDFLLREPAPQTGRYARYRRQWFGRIVERYRGSRTKVIFIRLARGPIPPPGRPKVQPRNSIRDFGSVPNVIVLNEHAFESLEHPELFADGMHFNDDGARQFTILLSEEVGRVLRTSEQARNGN